jgi:ribonuclease HII
MNNEDKKSLLNKGVIGIDEVGRGPFAGPVTLCAVYIEDSRIIKRDIFHKTIRDSKKLSNISRNKIYTTIRKNRELKTKVIYAISSRGATYIDKKGINKAIKQCLLSCVRSLIKQKVPVYSLKIQLDAGLIIPLNGLNQKSFVKGDEKYVEIALASVLAKEWRDNYMKKLAKEHDKYLWDKNMGYGTLDHRNAIKKYGVTKYHRVSYLKK